MNTKQLIRLSAALLLASCRAADVPISGLPAITTVGPTTLVPVVDVSGTPATKKATVSQITSGLTAATGSAAGTMSAADKAKLDAATASATPSTLVLRDGSGNTAVNILTATTVTGLSAPTDSSDAANKGYVDAASAGLIIKVAVVASTTANVTLSGGAPATLDGVSLLANDRVLVKNQSDPTQNGIYYVDTLGTGSDGTWARTADADDGSELVTGSYVFVAGGTVGVNAAWVMTTEGTITIGVSNITWTLFSQITSIAASQITGQIKGIQMVDGTITKAKFAGGVGGIVPIELLASLPTTGNSGGRTVLLTSDYKLYRFNGTAFTTAVATTDLTGTIATAQIADNAVTTAKLAAASVTPAKLGVVILSDISANLGTITGGEIAGGEITGATVTGTATVSFGSGSDNVLLSSAGLNVSSGRMTLLPGTSPLFTLTGAGAYADDVITLLGSDGTSRPQIYVTNEATGGLIRLSGAGIELEGDIPLVVKSGASIYNVGADVDNVNISSEGLVLASGRIAFKDGAIPVVRAYGTDSYQYDYAGLSGGTDSTGPNIRLSVFGGPIFQASATGVSFDGNIPVVIHSGSTLQGPGDLNVKVSDTGNALNIVVDESATVGADAGYIVVSINGVNRKIKIYEE